MSTTWCARWSSVKPQGIIHLGDGWRDVEELRELFPSLPLEQVPGNCDFGALKAL